MICLVTDRKRLVTPDQFPTTASADAASRLVDLVGAAAAAGVDLIQIRERDLEARELTALVRRCAAAVHGTTAKLVVNERVDVAIAGGAHGVHLRSDSMEAAAARRLLPHPALVGRSVHRAVEVAEASGSGALDYLVIGTLFATVSKVQTHDLLTLDELAAACRSSPVPILAIGGMTVERTSMAARAGAAGIAAIGLFIPPPDVSAHEYLASLVADLRRQFDTSARFPNN